MFSQYESRKIRQIKYALENYKMSEEGRNKLLFTLKKLEEDNMIKFEPGKIYYMTFGTYGPNLKDRIIKIKILSRTEKTVTAINLDEQRKFKSYVMVVDNVEAIMPYGRYPGAPMFKANKMRM